MKSLSVREHFCFIYAILIVCTLLGTWMVNGLQLPDSNNLHVDKKCELCTDIHFRFKKGLKETEKSNFGGGNTKWEEKSLGKYKFSETRLLEIMETLCDKTNKECHLMVEINEELIEKYWSSVFPNEPSTDFHHWFCIDNLKVCCPNGTFGPYCKDCPGGRERPCTGNGDCDGNGTRDGSGRCLCDDGYKGTLCELCKKRHYVVAQNDTHITCEECDESCRNCSGPGPQGCIFCKPEYTKYGNEGCIACDKSCEKCTAPGAQGCSSCKSGYVRYGSRGCIDVNECGTHQDNCNAGDYCHNIDGSYECLSCTDLCGSCTGPGMENCLACEEGYKLEGGTCNDIDECLDEVTCPEELKYCINTVGSYTCACVKGYTLHRDYCIPDDVMKDQTLETEDDDDEDKPDHHDADEL